MLPLILKVSFKKIKLLALLSACLSLFLLKSIGEWGELFYFILHVFTLGIAHGALDRWMFNLSNQSKKISKSQFYGGYLVVMAVIILVWMLSAPAALVLFLLYSAWHFGEVEWAHIFETNSVLQKIYCFTWGVFLFLSMFYFNSTETVSVINQVLGLAFEIDSSMEKAAVWIPLIWMIISFIPFLFKWTSKSHLFIQISNVLVLSLIFYSFNLAISFAVFFFYFHSLPSLAFELKFIGESSAGKANFNAVIKEMIVLSVAPLILGIAVVLIGEEEFMVGMLPVLVILGSTISFPHTFIYAWATLKQPSIKAHRIG